jgi:outer membrane protein assembly factor BamB
MPTATAAQQAPSLHLILDGHFASPSSNSLRSTLVALDAHDGHVVWKHPLETPSASDGDYARFPAVTANGTVYLGYYYSPQATALHYSVLEALDATTGQARWRQELDAGHETEIAGLPVVVGATVYLTTSVFQVPGQTGLVAAFDARSGTVLWRKALADMPSMPAVAGGNVLVLTTSQDGSTGHLLALRASDALTAWDYTASFMLRRGDDLENGYSTAPVVSGNLVFVQGGGAQLAINLRDGSLAWQYGAEGFLETPALNQSGDTLCLGISVASSGSQSSRAVGLASATGQQRWSVDLPVFASGCVPWGDTFLVNAGTLTAASGSILALRSQDGRSIWKTATGGQVDADGALAPTVSDGLAVDYLPADAHGAAAVDGVRASDGHIIWRQSFSGHPDFSADVEGDVLYNPEQQGSLPAVTAYALSTGVRLWTYTLGNG